MWTFSTLCPSFLSGVVREVDYSQDYTRDASCTHVLHNCAALISDRVPQVPSLPCNRESRSLSSFLKLEKCCWGPAYWNLDKEHLAGMLPNHTVICMLQSAGFQRSLYLKVVQAFCIKYASCFISMGGTADDQWGSLTEEDFQCKATRVPWDAAAALRRLQHSEPAACIKDGECAPQTCVLFFPSSQTSVNALRCSEMVEGLWWGSWLEN